MDNINCGKHKIKFDEACVNLAPGDNDNSWLYSLSTDCALCPFRRLGQISRESNTSVKIGTVRSVRLRVFDFEEQIVPAEYISGKNTSNVICDLSPKLGQYGRYQLAVRNQSCDLETLIEPTYPFTELFTVWGVVILFLLACSAGKLLWQAFSRKYRKRRSEENVPKISRKTRVRALDTFRGASTLMMIWVNGGSGGYAILGHATWNGLLFSDLIFPCFLWIMGVCIPIGISSRLKRMTPKHVMTYSIIKRSLLLFLIGLALNTVAMPEQLEQIRIFGVLQRFGVTYLVVALTYLYLIPVKPKNEQSSWRWIRDTVILLPQWGLMIIILIIHNVLTFSLKVPGCPTGYLGPGGRHDDGKYFNCSGGATGYIDRIVLGTDHLYQKPATLYVYGSGPYDPEGILGCLTSIFQVFLGVQAGMIMMTFKGWKERVLRWLLWAVVYSVIGCALHFSNVIPVNKSLWSLSFVLVTTSFALAFLSACYLLVDVVRIWNGGPFRIPGMNALVLYIGHIVCYKVFPFHWQIGDMSSRMLKMIESVWCVGLWTIVAYIMHRKRTYITL